MCDISRIIMTLHIILRVLKMYKDKVHRRLLFLLDSRFPEAQTGWGSAGYTSCGCGPSSVRLTLLPRILNKSGSSSLRRGLGHSG